MTKKDVVDLIPSVEVPSLAVKTTLPTAAWQQSDGLPIVILTREQVEAGYTKFAGWVYLELLGYTPTPPDPPDPTPTYADWDAIIQQQLDNGFIVNGIPYDVVPTTEVGSNIYQSILVDPTEPVPQ
jgi:hypothetical protein